MMRISSNYIPKYYEIRNDQGKDYNPNVIYTTFYRVGSGLRYFLYSVNDIRKLTFLYSIVQAMRVLKDIQIVHMDIKLENTLVGRDLSFKLSDFG